MVHTFDKPGKFKNVDDDDSSHFGSDVFVT